LAIYINIINKRPIYTCAPPGDDKKSHSDLLRNPEKLEKPGPVQLLATDPTKTNATMQPIAEDCFPKKNEQMFQVQQLLCEIVENISKLLN
jgi:hypothetical protein